MATTKLNDIIRAAARRLKDKRTSAAATDDTNKVFKSADLTEYANLAVREFLIEKLQTLGLKAFAATIPEYVKESGVLTLAGGLVAKPTDAFLVVDLYKSDNTAFFDRIDATTARAINTGREKLLVPSMTRPVFWEENGNIYTLPSGVASWDVKAFYVVSHQDLVVITSATGNGKIFTDAANLTWTAATKTLTRAGGAGSVTTADLNKLLFFRTATVVYPARIASVSGDLNIVLYGDGLPAGDIAAPNIIEIVISDLDPDGNDLKLNNNWKSYIIDRVVKYGQADQSAGIV